MLNLLTEQKDEELI